MLTNLKIHIIRPGYIYKELVCWLRSLIWISFVIVLTTPLLECATSENVLSHASSIVISIGQTKAPQLSQDLK